MDIKDKTLKKRNLSLTNPFSKIRSKLKKISPSFETTEYCNNLFTKKQEELLIAMLPHVDFDGWGYKSLHSAAQSLGMPISEAESYFPHAQTSDFIRMASSLLDEKALQAQQLNKQKIGVTATIVSLLETRMNYEDLNYSAAKKAFMYLMMPLNNALALKLAWQTCDKIWTFAGSNKSDPAYFSKRLILLGVYLTTWFVWMAYSKSNITLAKRFLSRQVSRSLYFGKKYRSFKSSYPPNASDLISKIYKKTASYLNSDFKSFMKSRIGMNS